MTTPHLDYLVPRIFGIETEYGILAAGPNGSPTADADTAGRTLFAKVVNRTQSTSVFLENGARLYLDVGSHPEYATAECRDLCDILAQDRAGGEILSEMAEIASKTLSEQTGTPTQIHLFKNNLDSAGNSCGCHENYLLYRSGRFRDLVDSLVAFLVTRQIVTGSGALLKIKGETKFCLSGRAFQIDDTVSAATTSTRPLVNTRDEPHGDAKLYRRLHVIVGDSNVLESPTRFKIATMNLLLGALEAGVDFSDLALAKPIVALQTISQSKQDGAPSLELANGTFRTPVEIQREFLHRLHLAYESADLGEDYLEVMREWSEWLGILEKGDLEKLVGILDWTTKKFLLERLRSRGGLKWEDPKLARLDLAYHDLVAGLNLEERGLARRLSDRESVQAAKTIPPANTRAALRGKIIAQAQQARVDLQVDWTHLRLPESGLGTVTLSDPFATQSAQVAKLMETMETD